MALRFICVFFLLINTALAQAPARMISGFPPGGAVDILARVFAEEWSKSIGRPVIVENLTGAGGLLAMQNLKNAAPDGNTLAVSTDSSLMVYPHTVAKPLYNTFSDFTLIAHTGSTVYALAIGTHVPAKDFSEFVAWAKANPDKSSFGASGAGSALQFYGILIAQTVGMPMTHIPYKGVGPSVADMIGGQIAATVVPLGTVLPQVKSGKARVLAHSGTTRLASLPEAPTFKELGYPTLESPVWFGIIGPAGMQPDMVNRLNETFVQAMRTPFVRERMARLDLEIREMSAAQFAAMMKNDYERWGRVVKASGWKPGSE
jgi:tripartite-type tricarboxylate transporter receptor subunit TctC